MPIKCPANGSWNCEACGDEMCYRRVHRHLVDWGLPHELAWEIAVQYKYSHPGEH